MKKTTLAKHYFWLIESHRDHKSHTDYKEIFRFRSRLDRDERLKNWGGQAIPANHPEIRRLNMRMSRGEVITFPYEIKD